MKFFGTFSIILLTWTVWPLLIRKSSAQYWFLGGIGCALLLLAWEYFSAMSLHQLLAVRSDFFLLKRSSNALAILFWPALFTLRFYTRRIESVSWIVWGVGTASGMLLFYCGSGSAKFSLLTGLLIYILGQSLAHLKFKERHLNLRYICGGIIVINFLGSPLLGVLSASLPPSFSAILSSYHAAERILIWQEFSQKIWEAPFVGSGFDSSPSLNVRISEPLIRANLLQPTTESVSFFYLLENYTDAFFNNRKKEERRDISKIQISKRNLIDSLPILESQVQQQETDPSSRLHALHPHNFPLQIWCELGIVGILFALLSLFYFLKMIQHQEAKLEIEKWTILMAAFALTLVSFGAWEGWWWVSLQAAFLWHYQERRTAVLQL